MGRRTAPKFNMRQRSLRGWPLVQGGKLQIGAPHGNWQMVVVYRGKHDPVRSIVLQNGLHCICTYFIATELVVVMQTLPSDQ